MEAPLSELARCDGSRAVALTDADNIGSADGEARREKEDRQELERRRLQSPLASSVMKGGIRPHHNSPISKRISVSP